MSDWRGIEAEAQEYEWGRVGTTVRTLLRRAVRHGQERGLDQAAERVRKMGEGMFGDAWGPIGHGASAVVCGVVAKAISEMEPSALDEEPTDE